MKTKHLSFTQVLQAITTSLLPVTLKVFSQDRWSEDIILTDRSIREVVGLLGGLGTEELILKFGDTELKTCKANANYFAFEADKINPNIL